MGDLEEIYRQHADTVYRFLLARTCSTQLAEELTQETFYQAVKSISRFDGSCQVSTWLIAIAKNVLRAYWKKQTNSDVPLENIPEPSVSSAEDTVLAGLAADDIYAAIHKMAEPGREIMYLRLLGGLSFKQIGDIMNHTETWVRVNYYRARQNLAKELSEYE